MHKEFGVLVAGRLLYIPRHGISTIFLVLARINFYMSHWTDAIIRERMAVDEEFEMNIADSEFTKQEWNIMMSMLDLKITNVDDPENAQVGANMEKLPEILKKMESVETRPNQSAADTGEPKGIAGKLRAKLFGVKVGDVISFDRGDDEIDAERLQTAEQLVDDYLSNLQSQLETRGSMARACTAYKRNRE